MARTYAICSKGKVVLEVLCILLLGLLMPNIVCDYTIIVHYEPDISQVIAFIDNCIISPTHVILYAGQNMVIKFMYWHADCRGVISSPYMWCWPLTSLPGGTIGTAFELLFDTVVIAVTLYHMLGTWWLQKGIKFIHKRSLTRLMLQQGRLCPGAIIIDNIMAENKYPTRHHMLQKKMRWYHCM